MWRRRGFRGGGRGWKRGSAGAMTGGMPVNNPLPRFNNERQANLFNRRGVGAMTATVDVDSCSGCGVCDVECPSGAITVRDTAVVDEKLCSGCGICVATCPAGALSLR